MKLFAQRKVKRPEPRVSIFYHQGEFHVCFHFFLCSATPEFERKTKEHCDRCVAWWISITLECNNVTLIEFVSDFIKKNFMCVNRTENIVNISKLIKIFQILPILSTFVTPLLLCHLREHTSGAPQNQNIHKYVNSYKFVLHTKLPVNCFSCSFCSIIEMTPHLGRSGSIFIHISNFCLFIYFCLWLVPSTFMVVDAYIWSKSTHWCIAFQKMVD